MHGVQSLPLLDVVMGMQLWPYASPHSLVPTPPLRSRLLVWLGLLLRSPSTCPRCAVLTASFPVAPVRRDVLTPSCGSVRLDNRGGKSATAQLLVSNTRHS